MMEKDRGDLKDICPQCFGHNDHELDDHFCPECYLHNWKWDNCIKISRIVTSLEAIYPKVQKAILDLGDKKVGHA